MRAFIFRATVLGSAFLCLTACTSLRLSHQGSQNFKQVSWEKRRASLSRLNRWDIDGAFSFKRGKENHIVSYVWDQSGQNYQIKIQSALDVYSLIIKGRPGKVTLWESDKKPQTARSASALMEKRLGWSLPVSYLTYWVRGLPAATSQYNAHMDRYGHLSLLTQNGWRVKFSSYTNVGKYDLPQRISITGHGLQIKIVVKHWKL